MIQKWKCTHQQNADVSLAQEFQNHLSNASLQTGILDNVKQKSSSKQNWTNREYNVKKYEDVEHEDVKMYCATNQFPELPFVVRKTNHMV